MKDNLKNNFVGDLNENLPYEQLFALLNADDFNKKHYAITCINYLKERKDIEHLIKNLVDQDTKIREITSFKICDFVLEDNSLIEFLDKNSEITLRTADDVNPQVCRNITKLLKMSNKKDFFAQKFLEKITYCIEETRSIRAKSHKVNKVIFNLYWNLYAIENLITKDFKLANELYKILEQATQYKDYTIRERAAFLTKRLSENGFDVSNLINQFKNDENFYVKNVF